MIDANKRMFSINACKMALMMVHKYVLLNPKTFGNEFEGGCLLDIIIRISFQEIYPTKQKRLKYRKLIADKMKDLTVI